MILRSHLKTEPETNFERSQTEPETVPEENNTDPEPKNLDIETDIQKSNKMSEKQKLDELHTLLVSMSDIFQKRLQEVSSDCHNQILAVKSELEKKLQDISSKGKTTSEETEEILGEAGSPEANKVVYIRSDKLVDLPRFDGNPTDWPMFISQFKITTKRNMYDNVSNNVRLNKF